MPTLTADDVRAVLGPVDDSLVAELLATDASREELVEAYTWITNDEAPMNAGRPLASGRVVSSSTFLRRRWRTNRPCRRCDQARAAKRPWSLVGANRTLQGRRPRLGVVHYLSFPSLRPTGPLSSGTSMSCSSNTAHGSTSTRRRTPSGRCAVLGVGFSAAVRRAPRLPSVLPVAGRFGAMGVPCPAAMSHHSPRASPGPRGPTRTAAREDGARGPPTPVRCSWPPRGVASPLARVPFQAVLAE